jgi:hypothetical protein
MSIATESVKKKKTLSEIKYRHLFNSRVVFYNFI